MVEAPTKPNGDNLKRILIGLTVVLLVGIVGSVAFVVGRESQSSATIRTADAEFDYSVLNQVKEILGENYVKPDNLDDEALFEAAVNGMLGLLNDDGTYYVRPSDFQLDTTLTGSFEGIGATISSQNNEIVIISTFKDAPAAMAGLQPGDVIIAVDGESAAGWTSEKTALTIRGPKGTAVIVRVRHVSGDEEDYRLIRNTVQVESVTTAPPGGVLRDENGALVEGIGYVQIREFSRRTAQELDDAIREEVKKGAKALIIDVRFNGGGLLSSTLASVDLFLDSGTIAIQRDGDGQETIFSAKAGQTADVPLIVLQNRFSASASEILTAALKDNERATIVGETSFGKGTVNTAKELANGGAVYVSIAHWLTPAGALIDKVGVRPDVEVIPTDEDIDLRRDAQLRRAVQMLLAEIQAAVP